MWFSNPIAPESTSSLTLSQWLCQRRLWLICSRTPARLQASIMASHSSSDSAMGFSQMIARVVGAAAHPSTISRCSSGCVAMMQTSGPTSSSIWR